MKMDLKRLSSNKIKRLLLQYTAIKLSLFKGKGAEIGNWMNLTDWLKENWLIISQGLAPGRPAKKIIDASVPSTPVLWVVQDSFLANQ